MSAQSHSGDRSVLSTGSASLAADAGHRPEGGRVRHDQRIGRGPVLLLRVSRGRTRSPARPVFAGRFLIGGGEGCDLRLGGDEVPLLHSIVVAEGTAARIEAVADEPLLMLNGAPIDSAELADGDRIGIGSFCFTVHLVGALSLTTTIDTASSVDAPARADDADNLHDSLSGLSTPEADISSLSAAELLERIERDQQAVDEFETRRRLGAAALLQAAGRTRSQESGVRSQGSAVSGQEVDNGQRTTGNGQYQSSIVNRQSSIPTSHATNHSPAALEEALKRLGACAAELSRREAEIDARAAGQSRAADELLEAQQKLAEQLEALVRHLETLSRDVQEGTAIRRAA